ncbi:uncharacterized LOC729966 homolog isoform X1 [Mus musculus]|uniref:uncharacterized LOC729966 homolog isoform X1 n=1 Tax=Mus musculus TaxID=10090 RepID=UPI0007ED119E|nr:uncharacterized LOC729966 homolog isoform X1 [Mus musculus]|eukprot:XP_017167982.1 PREDICTED: uncharacterized protein LOC100502950 isoform X1 [Mus musculus]
MASSWLLPLALALLLLGDSSVILASRDVNFTLFLKSLIAKKASDTISPSPETTPDSTYTSLETISPPDSTTPNPGSASPDPETASLPTSGFPSSEPTTTSQSTNLPPQGLSTVSSPHQDAGSLWTPTSYRNPGVVIAVCLLVSVLLVGSAFVAVRHYNRDAPAFHNLDTVSMGSVSQRLPFADRLQS